LARLDSAAIALKSLAEELSVGATASVAAGVTAYVAAEPGFQNKIFKHQLLKQLFKIIIYHFNGVALDYDTSRKPSLKTVPFPRE